MFQHVISQMWQIIAKERIDMTYFPCIVSTHELIQVVGGVNASRMVCEKKFFGIVDENKTDRAMRATYFFLF